MSTIAASRRASSATAKRPAMAESAGGPKAAGAAAAQAKKRVALGNITNIAAQGGRAAGKVAPPPASAVRTPLRPTTRMIWGTSPGVGPQDDSSFLARLFF